MGARFYRLRRRLTRRTLRARSPCARRLRGREKSHPETGRTTMKMRIAMAVGLLATLPLLAIAAEEKPGDRPGDTLDHAAERARRPRAPEDRQGFHPRAVGGRCTDLAGRHGSGPDRLPHAAGSAEIQRARDHRGEAGGEHPSRPRCTPAPLARPDGRRSEDRRRDAGHPPGAGAQCLRDANGAGAASAACRSPRTWRPIPRPTR